MTNNKNVGGLFPAISKMFDNFLNEDFFNLPSNVMDWASTSPAVNVREAENGFSLEVAAPGLKKEDFNLKINDGVLTISAERKVETNDEQDNYIRKGFSFSSFRRSFRLPDNVDSTKIGAKYEDGVLHIQLPKKEVTKAEAGHTITIE